MRNCHDEDCIHEWCDRNRTECDWLVPSERGGSQFCGKPTTWLATVRDSRFPLAFCKEHEPKESE